MALYHLEVKIISRGKGKSAVAAAAYRAGENISSEYDGRVNDYTRKGDVVHKEILLPENVPPEYRDRAVLWNAVEKVEKAKNAQLAREIELALPLELTREQGISLVRDYVKKHFVDAGMCADVCVHDKDDGNPHAHILLTMRPFNEDGTWGDKQKKVYILDKNGEKIYDPVKRQYKCNKTQTNDWNEQTKAAEWRTGWADAVNAVLEKQGIAERVDHRSYSRQGIEQVPTIHLGPAASQMEKRGIRTERGDINREIAVTNQQLRQLRVRLNKLKDWLKEESKNTAPPTLADVIQNILTKREQSGKSSYYQSFANLKAASQMLIFLQTNQIQDMAGLMEKVKSLYGQQQDTMTNLNKSDRRIKVLDEHIRQANIYMAHKDVYEQYRQEKNPKKQSAFWENHQPEITLYQAAERYLKEIMNGRTGLPVKAWKDERTALAAGKAELNQEYARIKAEVQQVEIIQRNVDNILREETREQKQPTKTKGAEL